MSQLLKLVFNFATGGQDHPANVAEISDPIKLDENYTWNVAPIVTGLVGGPPLYTIEVSNDNINWDAYSALATDVDVNNPFDDNHLSFNYIRINHKVGGATAGTVKYPLNGKQL